MPNFCGQILSSPSPLCVEFFQSLFHRQAWATPGFIQVRSFCPLSGAWGLQPGVSTLLLWLCLWLIPILSLPGSFIGFSPCSPLCLYFLFVFQHLGDFPSVDMSSDMLPKMIFMSSTYSVFSDWELCLSTVELFCCLIFFTCIFPFLNELHNLF